MPRRKDTRITFSTSRFADAIAAGGTVADSDPRGSGSWFVGLKY